MRIYLDTNALISAIEGTDAPSDAVRSLLETDVSKARFVSSELTMSELLVKPLRNGHAGLARDVMALFASGSGIGAVAIDRAILVAAADLRARFASLKFQDAVHLATALQEECARFVSNDHRLPRLESFEFVRLQAPVLLALVDELALAR